MQIPDTLLIVCWNEQQSVTGMLASTPWCFGGFLFPHFFLGVGVLSCDIVAKNISWRLSLWCCPESPGRLTVSSGRSVSTCDCDNSTGLLKRKKSNGFWVISPVSFLYNCGHFAVIYFVVVIIPEEYLTVAGVPSAISLFSPLSLRTSSRIRWSLGASSPMAVRPSFCRY